MNEHRATSASSPHVEHGVTPYLLASASVILGVLGQLCMKQGMQILSQEQVFEAGLSLMAGLSVALSPWVLAGLCSYALAMAVWVAVLSRLDLGYAYPLLSAGYVLTALGAWWWFGDDISLQRWCGIALISLGVGIAARE